MDTTQSQENPSGARVCSTWRREPERYRRIWIDSPGGAQKWAQYFGVTRSGTNRNECSVPSTHARGLAERVSNVSVTQGGCMAERRLKGRACRAARLATPSSITAVRASRFAGATPCWSSRARIARVAASASITGICRSIRIGHRSPIDRRLS